VLKLLTIPVLHKSILSEMRGSNCILLSPLPLAAVIEKESIVLPGGKQLE
jgi:hypothetical protein